MPKINVYLPDELADAVKESGLPVSAICQRALEQSVRRVTAIREAVLSDLEITDPAAHLSRFTKRAATVVTLAIEQARVDGATTVGTQHLLHGLLAEGENMALMVLTAIDIDPRQLAGDLAAIPKPGAETDQANRFDGAAANAIELAVTEAISLGHNYVGCEHLLLGLVSEPDGLGGHLLRTRGVELRLTRRAISAALAGLVHVKSQSPSKPEPDPAQLVAEVVRRELEPLTRRLDRLEQHAGIS